MGLKAKFLAEYIEYGCTGLYAWMSATVARASVTEISNTIDRVRIYKEDFVLSFCTMKDDRIRFQADLYGVKILEESDRNEETVKVLVKGSYIKFMDEHYTIPPLYPSDSHSLWGD